MKKIFIAITPFFLFLASLLYAEEHSPSIQAQDEISVLEELISMTKKSLAEQETLLLEMKKYQFTRENFLENPDSPKWATLLVKASLALKKTMQTGNWAHLFSKDFLEEITFYTEVGKQHGLG